MGGEGWLGGGCRGSQHHASDTDAHHFTHPPSSPPPAPPSLPPPSPTPQFLLPPATIVAVAIAHAASALTLVATLAVATTFACQHQTALPPSCLPPLHAPATSVTASNVSVKGPVIVAALPLRPSHNPHFHFSSLGLFRIAFALRSSCAFVCMRIHSLRCGWSSAQDVAAAYRLARTTPNNHLL